MARGRKRADTAPGPGHNGPTDELVRDYARRLDLAKRELREVMDEAAAKRGVITGIKKAAKKSWVDVVALARVVDEAVEDQDEVIARERAYIRMRAVLAMPIVQDDLFPKDAPAPVLSAEEAEKQALHQAGSAGYMAGINGHDIDKSNPYDTGTEPWVKFREQWHAGQAHIVKGMNRPRPTPSNKRRADPPAAANDEAPTDPGDVGAAIH